MSELHLILLVTIDSLIIHAFIILTVTKKYISAIPLILSNGFRFMLNLYLYIFLQFGTSEIYLVIVFFSPIIWISEFYVLYKLGKSYFPPLIIIVTNLSFLQISLFLLDLNVFLDKPILPLVINTQPFILCLFLFIGHKINLKYQILYHLFTLQKKYTFFSILSFLWFITIFICHSLASRNISKLSSYVYTSFLIYISLIFLYVLLYQYITQKNKNDELNLQIKRAFYSNEQIKIANEFRHDYKAILISLSTSLNQENIQAAKTQLNDIITYSKPILDNNYYNELTKLKIPTIQYFLFTFVQNCINNDVDVKLTIRNEINDVNINIIDLSRCISIICNNALEAISDSPSKSLKISITNVNNEFNFSIENNIIQPLELKDVLHKGYTTKNNHAGYGLSNFIKILKQYKNAHYFFNTTDDSFIVSFSIS